MLKKTDLYKATKKILKDIRFGKLSERLALEKFPEDAEFVTDFNNMLETIEDREAMIAEYKNYIFNQNEHLKNLFNMLNEGAITISDDYKILSVNDIQAKWLRKSKKYLVDTPIIQVLKKYTIREYPSNKIIDNPLSILSTERKNATLSFEYKNVSMVFSISVKSFFTKEKKLNYFIIAKDITSDINLQKLKDTFVATLTHDLKVPIVAEAKILELLLKETFGENSSAQKEAFLNMKTNNTDMMSLVQTLLDAYKLDDAQYKISKEKTDINKLLMNVIEKLRFLTDENNCKIITDISQNLPQMSIDNNEISRVLQNLITNAINFSPTNSSILIKAYLEKTNLKISITDNGSGIEKEELPHIFDRYFSAAKKYRKVGTGLGLYLSKNIVNLHGGDIVVKSEPMKETTFTVILPIS